VFEPRRPQLEIFLRASKSDPDDDVPRLVLADWLQDHGDARGELVHLQVRRSRLADGDPDHARFRPREMRLLAQHSLRWLGPLADRASEWTFWRGLLEVEARAERFVTPEVLAMAGGEELLWVEELCLTEVEMHHLARLAETAVLDDLAALNLADNHLGRALARLLEVPALAGLRALGLRGNWISDVGATALAGCAALANLRVLDLSANRIGSVGAFALAESPYLDGLRSLNLRNNPIEPDGREALRARFGGAVRVRGAAG
jgi:uncharacterized protein (TIGR02996 family)